MKPTLTDILVEVFILVCCILPLMAVAMLGFFHTVFFLLGVI